MDFRTYYKTLKGPARDEFARRTGTTKNNLNMIAYGGRQVGEALAIVIERESAQAVTVEELRPDVDWQYIRNSRKPRAKAAA
jgi:DNA-binding transcriptional regulator YdaS (Cro superfamily)